MFHRFQLSKKFSRDCMSTPLKCLKCQIQYCWGWFRCTEYHITIFALQNVCTCACSRKGGKHVIGKIFTEFWMISIGKVSMCLSIIFFKQRFESAIKSGSVLWIFLQNENPINFKSHFVLRTFHPIVLKWIIRSLRQTIKLHSTQNWNTNILCHWTQLVLWQKCMCDSVCYVRRNTWSCQLHCLGFYCKSREKSVKRNADCALGDVIFASKQCVCVCMQKC